METYNLKENLPTYARKNTKANYMIYIDGKPTYCGESKDVFNRLQKHRVALRKGLFGNNKTGKSGKPLSIVFDESIIMVKIFNIGAGRKKIGKKGRVYSFRYQGKWIVTNNLYLYAKENGLSYQKLYRAWKFQKI